MAAASMENPLPRRSSPRTGAGMPDGDKAPETPSAQSWEVSDRGDVDTPNQVLWTRSEEYQLLFRLPSDEVLLRDFNCAFQENILIQGHMYLFVHHICFYSNIFGFETKKIIPLHEITCVRKAKTVAIFSNAIEIVAGEKKYFFGSFLSRDEAYRLIIDGWVQHGGDIKSLDTKLDASGQENSNLVFEQVHGSTMSADDLSSSNRIKDDKALPNDKVYDLSVKLSEVKENVFTENSKEPSSEIPFSWAVEDMDAPIVPEHFTILGESKFPLLVKDFFSLFISDSAAVFLKDFHKRCGDKDFQCTSWRRHRRFGYTRNVSFQHPVKIYLGAKFGSCKEVQKFRVFKNSHLMIITSQQIQDVPYGDYFEVEGIWDVVQDNDRENSCTVKVYSNVSFSKKTLFRGKIEQSTKDECREIYETWMDIAHELVKEKNVGQMKADILEQNTCLVQETGSQFEIPTEFDLSKENLTTNSPTELEVSKENLATISPKELEVSKENLTTISPTELEVSKGNLTTNSPKELEVPKENLTTNSSNLARNVHETRSSGPVIEKNMKEKSEKFPSVVAILQQSWKTLLSYVKARSLLPLVLAGAGFVFIVMQLSIILLATRVSEVQLVTHRNYASEVGIYKMEKIEWLEKRFNYLREEMLVVESRLESMRYEYALLKSHIQSFERLNANS